ncbi:MAG: CAP domain-containing protein [Eubacteriaceae bacterium]|nr:CAP domain-containing protein [Eubacteriaceae bacterium]
MKKIITGIILTILFLTIPTAVFADTADVKITGIYDYDSAYEVLDILNEERIKNGKSPLSMNKDLLASAMQRAAECCVFYGHTRPDGSDCFTAFPDVKVRAAGENIAAGQPDSSVVMNSWMNSTGHRENILADAFETVGVGCFYQPEIGVRTWVQLFSSDPAGGYITGGKKEGTAVVRVSVENFNMFCYNPSINEDEYYVYNRLCPGVTERFLLLGQNVGADLIHYILDEGSYSFRSLTKNIEVKDKNVRTISSGGALLGYYIGNIKVGQYTFEVGHTFADSATPPTCTEGGYTGTTCRRCGYEGSGEYVGPLGHDTVTYPAKEPDCTKEGTTESVFARDVKHTSLLPKRSPQRDIHMTNRLFFPHVWMADMTIMYAGTVISAMKTAIHTPPRRDISGTKDILT